MSWEDDVVILHCMPCSRALPGSTLYPRLCLALGRQVGDRQRGVRANVTASPAAEAEPREIVFPGGACEQGVSRGIPIMPTLGQVTAEMNRVREYLTGYVRQLAAARIHYEIANA